MRDRPHPNHKLEWPGGVVPEWAKPSQGARNRFGKGPRGAKGGGGKRERLQKVMAQSGHGSRRNIEILIAQGHITINGQVAKLGDSVGPGDKVKLDGHLIHLRFGDPLPRVLMYHKPEGEIVTRDDPEKRATVFDKLPKVNNGRWVSVGRLDLNTGGLLLFTTSGELANRLTHPRFEVEREYAVRVMGEIDEEKRKQLLETGVDIDGEKCTFDSIEDRGGEGANHWYHVVLREGRNREVRRMMEGVGLMVSRLMRVRFGNVLLAGHIKRGMFREMEEEQVQELLAFAGVNQPLPGEGPNEEEEDENENIGNRIDAAREARHVPEIDEDIGNRIHHPAAAREQREPDGNRGTYGEGPAPRPPKGRRPQAPHGAKPFGFKKRGQGQGGQGQGQGQAQGQPHGQGQQRKQGQGQPGRGPRPPGGQGQGQGQAQGPGGATGKPGRNRRNKNRGRKSNAQQQPRGEQQPRGDQQPRGEQQARGEQQPASNANREPF